MKTIIDTSTLISLARIGELERLLKVRAKIIIPEIVYTEAVLDGIKKDIADAFLIDVFLKNSLVEIKKISKNSLETLSKKLKKELYSGDRDVLALGIQEKALEIITNDDGLGKIASYLGFKVAASPDLFFECLKNKLISRDDFENGLRKLVLENRLSPKVAEFYIMEGKNVKD